jgi:organic hydroperoxide reductase OsmC/OhrA
MDAHFYEVNVSWKQDRKGIMSSPEIYSNLGENGCIEVATPPQFSKGMPGIWSPEHLFTAAVSSCLMTTFLAIAENSKLDFEAFECSAQGKLEKIDGRFLMTEVILKPIVTIVNEEDQDRALKVLQKSEAACLISNSITSKVMMLPVVTILEEAKID